VTEADRKAERAMRDLISAKFPDHGIFGEEEGMQQPKSSDAQYLWVLDPIDGTKSFITGTQHQQGQHVIEHSGFAVSMSFASCMVSQHLYTCAQAQQFDPGGGDVTDPMS